MGSSIKELMIQAGNTISLHRVLMIGITGKAHHASYESGMAFGVSSLANTGNGYVSYWTPGNIVSVTVGGTVTGADIVYVDNTGSGMVVKFPYTGSVWHPNASTGDLHYTDALISQLRDFHMIVGTIIDGAVSGSDAKMLFNPVF